MNNPLLTQLAFLLVLVITQISGAQPIKRQEFGWLEPVLIFPEKLLLKAKLDTGADHSSLHAENIEIKNGLVSFESRNHRGEQQLFTLPLEHITKVKRHHNAPLKRPVVRMGFCLGKHYLEGDVTLSNRKNYAFPLLLGRDILQFFAVVNPAVQFQTKPQCPKKLLPQSSLDNEQRHTDFE